MAKKGYVHGSPGIGLGGKVMSVNLYTSAGVPADGTSGFMAGEIEPGDLVMDITNKQLYIATNTSASPTYKQLTRAA